MHFLDDSLLPEHQQPLVIQAAPYGPQWLPGDSDDIPITMAEQVQKAVDCYNAGATVLHVHVREVPAGPAFVGEHIRRLVENGIQPHFQIGHLAQLHRPRATTRQATTRSSAWPAPTTGESTA